MDTTTSIVRRILAHRKTDYKRMLASNDASIKILSRVVLIDNVSMYGTRVYCISSTVSVPVTCRGNSDLCI